MNRNTGRPNVFGVLSGAFGVAIAIRFALEFASGLHWSVGAVLAALFGGVAVWLTWRVKQSRHRNSMEEVAALLTLGLLTLAVVGGWVSFMLHEYQLATYSIRSESSVAAFVDLYLYTFLDLIPGIDIWKTLPVLPPMEPKNVTAGLPLLGFKVFVVWLLIDAFTSWRKRTTDPRQIASREVNAEVPADEASDGGFTSSGHLRGSKAEIT